MPNTLNTDKPTSSQAAGREAVAELRRSDMVLGMRISREELGKLFAAGVASVSSAGMADDRALWRIKKREWRAAHPERNREMNKRHSQEWRDRRKMRTQSSATAALVAAEATP
jgi:hypothetical protein